MLVQVLLLALLSSLLLLSSAVASVDESAPSTLAPSQEVKTVIEWSRQLRTCDEVADRDIPVSGTSRVIYAIGKEDPKDDTHVNVHSLMGVKNINLLDSAATTPAPSDSHNITLMSRSFPISPDSDQKPGTYYHCQGFAANFSQKAHVIRVTPRIDYAHSALVHHMLLFKCPNPFTQAELDWAGNCYTQDTPKPVSQCDQVSVIAGWAVGGGEFVYPPDVGFPIGEEAGTTYMMLQIHYHNPNGLTFNDSAGFALHLTHQLRKYDAGTFYLHQWPNPTNINIPPQQQSYEIGVYCPDECLGFPAEGVNVFASMLHTHEAGVALWTEHFRGGVQLPNIDSNMAYDFNFQQVITMSPNAYPVLKKGDNLKLTCRYNTMGRTANTTGGIATTDEMCMDYLWHYPALKLDACTGISGGNGAPAAGNFSASCNYGHSSRSNAINFAAPPVEVPLPPVSCTPAALGNRSFNGDGTSSTKAISAEQWMANKASYSRSIILDDQGDFVLYWNVSLDADGQNGVIRMAAEVATSGWFGLGISASGAMIDADSVIGWVHTVVEGGQQVTVDMTDRYNAEYRMPPIDASQDVFDVVGVQAMMDIIVPRPNPIYYNFTAGEPPCHHNCPGPSSSSSGLTIGAMVGIAVGSIAGTLIVVGILYALFRVHVSARQSSSVGGADLSGLNDDSLLGGTVERRRNRDELKHGLLAGEPSTAF